ncbi:DMT family transporter [Nocardia otitidiscaviarum]|nr:DMT family transporter [Nocardia otitidiscaviarum]
MLLTGVACTAASAAFIALAATSAGTAAFFRCALALPVLIPLALAERRRSASWRIHPAPLAAGALLGIDYVFWSASIHEVGAAVSTVLINIQVIVFPILVAAAERTPIPRRFWVTAPIMLVGIVLASGATAGPTGAGDPLAGLAYGACAGLAYSGYLYLMRRGSIAGSAVTPVCTSTTAAACTAGAFGLLWGGIDFTPDRNALGWLLALALLGQVLTWLLITTALPRLSPGTSSALLALHPVLAVALGVGIGEHLTAAQFAGCAVVVATAYLATRGQRTVPNPDRPTDPGPEPGMPVDDHADGTASNTAAGSQVRKRTLR